MRMIAASAQVLRERVVNFVLHSQVSCPLTGSGIVSRPVLIAGTQVRIMQAAILQFLRFLEVERNAAELTVKSYREDLTALDEYLGQAYSRAADPAEITPLDLRGYVSAMHEAGYAKTSISRR